MELPSLFGVSLPLCLSLSSHVPFLTTITLWHFPSHWLRSSFSATSSLLCGVCLSCAYCRLALDDAIRHKQLNISRFSPRVAGENDFLQTVINKVITAKEVNHKGQGMVHIPHAGTTTPPPLSFLTFKVRNEYMFQLAVALKNSVANGSFSNQQRLILFHYTTFPVSEYQMSDLTFQNNFTHPSSGYNLS